MKSYLKLLLAMLVAVICIMSCISCGSAVYSDGSESSSVSGAVAEGVANAPAEIDPDLITPTLPPVDEWYLDYYHVKFVYRYYTVFINESKRMELKATDELLAMFYIPLENEGFTEDHRLLLSAIEAATGMTVDGWYLGWNSITRKVSGQKYDFTSNTPINSDLTFYLDRGSYAGDTATYTLQENFDETMTLTISGSGRMFDFEEVDGVTIPWYEQRNKITKIIVEDGITYIGKNAFNGLSKVTELVLPDSIVEIGDTAFQGCKGITTFTSPASLKVIGVSAFASTGLTFLRLREGVEQIKESAFNDSNKISTIHIPSTLKYVGTSAFYPGVTGGSLNESYIKYVYSHGTREQFAQVEIGLDNAWFNELSLLYFVLDEGQDPDENPGPYWRDVNGTPVPYYFMINYYLPSSYGIKTPAFTDYVRTEYTVDRSGVITVTATVTEANEHFPNSIVYNNYKFGNFSGAVKKGDILLDAASVTCVTATTPNKGNLSTNGGIKWEYNTSTAHLSISAVEIANASEVIKYLRSAYKDYSISADTKLSDLLGIATLDDFEVIKSVGFTDMDEFMKLAERLEALDIYSSSDSLVATALLISAAGVNTAAELKAISKAISELGIVTYDKADEIIAILTAAGVDSLEEIDALIASEQIPDGVTLAQLQKLSGDFRAANVLTNLKASVTLYKAVMESSGLDSVSISDFVAKLVKAEIDGNIAKEFADIKEKLEGFEALNFNVSDAQAKYFTRLEALKEFASLTLSEFAAGDYNVYNSTDMTVGEVAEYIAQAQISENVYKIWDFATSKDTPAMWGSSVKSISVKGNVEHIGSYTFAGLSKLESIEIPATVKSIDVSAFDGCGNLHSIYYQGADLTECIVEGAGEGTTLYNVRFGGTKAQVYSKTESATGSDGKYWLELGDDRIAWSLIDGTLTVGGPAQMYDFDNPEDAPWYSARDTVTAIVIPAHITSVGKNIANGYANVNSISFSGKAVKNIAASAFSDTGLLLNDKNYRYGALVVNDYLLAAKTDDNFLEVPFYTVLIAGGAFDNCPNLEGVYIPSTMQNIAPDVFADSVPYLIFYDGSSTQWELISANLQFPEAAVYHVALEILEDGDEGRYEQFEWDYDEYVCKLTSCIHEWTEWNVITEPTCTKTGLRTHSCNGVCQAKDVEDIIPALGHTWSEWEYVEGDPFAQWHICVSEDCDAADKGYTVSAKEGFINFKDFEVIADGTTIEAGTDKYFTVILGTYAKIDGSSASFVTGKDAEGVDIKETIAGRLYFGEDPSFENKSAGTIAKNLIKFTTTDAASVTIYWTHNWNSSREMAIFDSEGVVVTQTEAKATTYGKTYISTLELTRAGEYYLGALNNHTNAIFKVVVTQGENTYTLNVGTDLEKTATWSSSNTSDVVITIGNNTAANAKVVEVDGEKYFHYERIGNTSSGTSIKFSNNTITPVDGQSVVFDMFINQKHIGSSVNSAYFKFSNADGEIRGASHYWFYGAAGDTNGNLTFKSSDNKVVISNIAPEGEWFVLRFVFTAQNKIQLWVKTDITSDDYVLKGEFAAPKSYEVRQIQLQSDASMIHSTDIKAAGFTLIEGVPEIDPEAPDENGRLPDANDENDKTVDEEITKVPEGTVIFGDINGGAWDPLYTEALIITPSASAAAETRVVRWQGNKYLEYSKFATDAISALSFVKTRETIAGEPVIFQAKIKYNHISASDALSTIKFIGDDSTEYAAITLSAAEGDALGYVRLNGESIGVKEDTWFTLTFKMVEGTVELYVDNYRVSTTAISGIENVTSLVIDSEAEALFKLDFDNVYFGGDFVPYKEKVNTEYLEAPLGTVVFGNIELGAWDTSKSADVEIKIGNSSRATAIVYQEESGNRYLEYLRTSTAGGTYINFKKLENTAPGEAVIFSTKIRHDHISSGANCAYFRFYNSAGSEYKINGQTYFFSATEGSMDRGNVKLGGLDTGVMENEWFTLTFKFTTNTVEVLINGESFTTYTVEGIENAVQVRLQSDSSMLHKTDFDNVYFGSENLVYPSEDDQLSGGNTVQLLPGAVSFDDIEIGAWSASLSSDVTITPGVASKSTTVVMEENGNKFIRYERISHQSSGTGISFATTQSIEAGQMVAFEARMRSWHLSSNLNCSYLYLQTSSGGRLNTATLWFSASAGEFADGEWNVSYMDSKYKFGLGVMEGEWFDIRIVCTPNDIVEFWTAPVGGEMVKRGEIPIKGASNMRKITLQSDATMIHRTDFDNVYMGEFIPDTLSDMPLPKDESTLSSGTVTMTGLKDGALPYDITYVKGDSDSTLGAVMVTRANKVLGFDKVAGSDPYFYLNATQKNVAANKAVFKTQMMFYELEEYGYIDFTLMPAGASSLDRVFKLRVAVTEDGKISLATVTLVDGVEVVGDAVVTGMPVDTWFTLRIEYTEADGKFCVYVDRNLAIESTTPYSVYKDAAAISKVVVNSDANLAGKIYFENLSLSQVVVE